MYKLIVERKHIQFSCAFLLMIQVNPRVFIYTVVYMNIFFARLINIPTVSETCDFNFYLKDKIKVSMLVEEKRVKLCWNSFLR